MVVVNDRETVCISSFLIGSPEIPINDFMFEDFLCEISHMDILKIILNISTINW